MENNAKYQMVSLYSAERYYNGKPVAISKRINITGKTKEEIDEMVAQVKAKQKEKNAQFKRMVALGQNIKTMPGKKELIIKFDKGTGNTFALFGASKSGKTTLMMKLYNEEFPRFVKLNELLTTLFAMNSQLPIYESKYILKFPDDAIDAMSKAEIKDYIEWERKINKLNENKFFFLNMFDDFINVRHAEIVNNLILTYRNSNISSILCLQYVNLLSKQARSNVNHVFLMHMNTDESIEIAVRVYLQSYIKKNGISDPINWYKDVTSNHGYIYLKPQDEIIEIIKP